MDKELLRQQALKLVGKVPTTRARTSIMPRKSKVENLKLIEGKLTRKENLYISTKNKYWFMTRFKDATGKKLVLTPIADSETMYKLSLSDE